SHRGEGAVAVAHEIVQVADAALAPGEEARLPRVELQRALRVDDRGEEAVGRDGQVDRGDDGFDGRARAIVVEAGDGAVRIRRRAVLAHVPVPRRHLAVRV